MIAWSALPCILTGWCMCCPAHRCEHLELLSISSIDLCVASICVWDLPWIACCLECPEDGLSNLQQNSIESVSFTQTCPVKSVSFVTVLWVTDDYQTMTSNCCITPCCIYACYAVTLNAEEWQHWCLSTTVCICTSKPTQANAVYLC